MNKIIFFPVMLLLHTFCLLSVTNYQYWIILSSENLRTLHLPVQADFQYCVKCQGMTCQSGFVTRVLFMLLNGLWSVPLKNYFYMVQYISISQAIIILYARSQIKEGQNWKGFFVSNYTWICWGNFCISFLSESIQTSIVSKCNFCIYIYISEPFAIL